MMADYKSRELTLYNNDGYKLQVRPIDSNSDVAPGFSIKTTLLNGAGDWGVHIPMLKVDTMYGLRTVGSSIGTHEYKIGLLEGGLAGEVTNRQNADITLQANIDSEAATRLAQDQTHTTAIAQEVSARTTGDFNLNAAIVSEAASRAAADVVLTNAVAQLNIDLPAEAVLARAEEKKLSDRINVEITARSDAVTAEAAARLSADNALGVRCDGLVAGAAAEVARAQAAEEKLSERIDFITSNVNPAALDSLTEIVANFNANGATYASRLLWLEGVVQELLNKSQ